MSTSIFTVIGYITTFIGLFLVACLAFTAVQESAGLVLGKRKRKPDLKKNPLPVHIYYGNSIIVLGKPILEYEEDDSYPIQRLYHVDTSDYQQEYAIVKFYLKGKTWDYHINKHNKTDAHRVINGWYDAEKAQELIPMPAEEWGVWKDDGGDDEFE